MPGLLDLDWKPSASSATPDAGHSAQIYRGDSYSHVIEFWEDVAETDPFAITGTVTAQIKTARLTSDDDGTVLAAFTCAVSGVGSNIVTISLTPAQTEDLPAAAYWDLQVDNGGVITTLITGKVKVWGDVTR
jgi:hypothetical protein